MLMISSMGSAYADGAGGPRMVEDGRGRVTVVLPATAGDQTKLAAADLTRCLGRALGVEVPTVPDRADAKTPLTIDLITGSDTSLGTDSLHRDGCVMTTSGDHLLIAGATDYGTANGVYTFLMDHVGVRWFAPGDLWEVVPPNPELALPQADVRRNPDFSFRIFSGVMGPEGTKWQRRNRLDVSRESLPYFGFGHNLNNIIVASKHGKDHPEYFPMIGGKRYVPAKDDDQNWQPCFTNPDVIRIAAEAADAYFKKVRTATTFSLCINDGMNFCECPDCQALDQPMRKANGGWNTYSDSYFHFVSEVAKLVQKTNPGKYLGCYAYWGVEPMPRKIEKLPDNVVIALTQDTSQHFDPAYKQADRDLWIAWSKVATHLSKYDYYGLGWLTPRYFPRLAGEDIRFIHANSAVGFYCEVYPNWSVTAPQLYMATRLLWDADQDWPKLLDEYYTSLFGPAAGEMRKFYATLAKYWSRDRQGRWFQGLDNIRPELAMADESIIEEAWQCLFRAKTLVIGPEAERIVEIEDHFKLTYTIVKGYSLARRLAAWEVKNRSDLAKLVSESVSALETIRLAEKVHAEEWLTDPLYKHTYYEGDRFHRKFWGWQDEVRAGVQSGLLTASGFARAKLPKDEYNTVWKDLKERLLSDPTAKRLGIIESIDPKVDCASARKPIKVDGDLSEWKSIEAIRLAANPSGGEPAADASVFLKMAWDRSFFYFACEVTEVEHVQDRADDMLWLKDSVQIAFDPKLDGLTNIGYGADDSEIGFALSPNGPVVWRWQSPDGLPGGLLKDVKLAIRRDGDRTIYEAAIPWSQLAFPSAAKDAAFGFSVAVNDAGSKRPRASLEWGGGILRTKDPKQFVPVRLK